MPSAKVVDFARMVRARSHENAGALRATSSRQLHGVTIGILRQELDSMVRVIYLLSLAPNLRTTLVEASLAGEPWKIPTPSGKLKKVTDRDMVDHAATLHGWAESVYRFGCAFIHLSQFHDYATRDPVAALTPGERAAMLRHLRGYHGGPARDDFTLVDVVPVLPPVFEKIRSNLDCYLRQLESGEKLDP
ncbi:MAG: hypothetical protein KF729_39255 [Sandaracinaceae bacterium]|nr:hypothetical protein [Sandaracinaceae bacterium]